MALKYVAGWSLPGCLPEMTPALFDTEEEAQAFIKEEQELVAEQNADAEFPTDDPYEYWVELINLTDEEVAAYEEDILL